MKVQRIQHNLQKQNFTAIRIVDKTSPRDVKKLQECFTDFANQNRLIRAESPAHNDFYIKLFETAYEAQVPSEWLIRNAEVHKILRPKEFETLPLFVFTQKDNSKLDWHELKNSFAYIKYGFKKAADYTGGIMPEHLLDLKLLRDFADSRIPVFKKFLAKNNAKTVTLEQLFEEISSNKI